MFITYSMLSVSSKYFLISFYFFSFMVGHILFHIYLLSSNILSVKGNLFSVLWKRRWEGYFSGLPSHWECIFFDFHIIEVELGLLLYSLSRPLDIKLVFCLFSSRSLIKIGNALGQMQIWCFACVSQFLFSPKFWPDNSLISGYFFILRFKNIFYKESHIFYSQDFVQIFQSMILSCFWKKYIASILLELSNQETLVD